ncbi:hypothetical protein O3M35_006677 [Rhynocoris fuscipes]|uniref:Odorant receptor n=1 Tax=Rhynocoris fuscipes TaxID=488301 RepID=A0AAW1DEL3_9HEMI
MNLIRKLDTFLKEIDKDGSEIVDKFVYDEYYYLFRLSLFYPYAKLNMFLLHLITLIFFCYIYSTHVILLLITAILTNDIILMIYSLYIACLLALFLSFIFTINSARKQFNSVHEMLGKGVYNYNEIETDEEILMKKAYHRSKNILKISLPITNIVGFIGVLIVGPWIEFTVNPIKLVQIYSEEGINFILPVNAWYPFQTHEGIGYYYGIISQILVGTALTITLTSATWIYFTTTTHILIQMERLIISLKNINERALNMYKKIINNNNIVFKHELYSDKDFIKCTEYCLKRNIEHHQAILSVFNDVTGMLKAPVFATLFTGSLILGLSAFIIAQGSDTPGIVLSSLTVATAEFMHITFICRAGQQISDLNQNLHLEFYNTPWFYCSKQFKDLLLVSQSVTSCELYLKTMFDFKSDMNTYSHILNTAYSYFSLLLAFKD